MTRFLTVTFLFTLLTHCAAPSAAAPETFDGDAGVGLAANDNDSDKARCSASVAVDVSYHTWLVIPQSRRFWGFGEASTWTVALRQARRDGIEKADAFIAKNGGTRTNPVTLYPSDCR